MSNYRSEAFNPLTGKVENADWIDNHFGNHIYGVQFDDGSVYHTHEVGLLAASNEIERLRAIPAKAEAEAGVREALEEIGHYAKKLRNGTDLIGPAEYLHDAKSMKVWQRALYHEGKTIEGMVKAALRGTVLVPPSKAATSLLISAALKDARKQLIEFGGDGREFGDCDAVQAAILDQIDAALANLPAKTDPKWANRPACSFPEMAPAKTERAAVVEDLRKLAIKQHVRLAQGGGHINNGKSCELCKGKWGDDAPERHGPSCPAALVPPLTGEG